MGRERPPGRLGAAREGNDGILWRCVLVDSNDLGIPTAGAVFDVGKKSGCPGPGEADVFEFAAPIESLHYKIISACLLSGESGDLEAIYTY